MRAIWKGHISFGLVNVPVTLYPAERRSDLSFHMIDSRNYSRVRYERVNAETGEEVPWDHIAKGYEYDDGTYVVLEKDELEQIAPEATQTIDVEAFVDVNDIDLVYFDKPYYLEPGKKGEKGYVLLREVLQDSGKAAIAKVVIRTRQYIAALVPRGKALVLMLLRYQQELVPQDELALPAGNGAKAKIGKQELNMAKTLVESMSTDWDPEQYHDEYREALMAWIEKKAKADGVERIPEAKASPEFPPTINLMEALKKSVQKSSAPSRKKKAKSARTRKKATRRKKAG